MPSKAKPAKSTPDLLPDEAPRPVRYSAFNEFGFKETTNALCEEIRELYLADQVPWIIGYHQSITPFVNHLARLAA